MRINVIYFLSNFEKAERALEKLIEIGAMMSDFQDIIKECEKDNAAAKKK